MTLKPWLGRRLVDALEAGAAGVDAAALSPPDSADRPVTYLHTAVWSEVALGGGWIAAYRLGVQESGPTITEIRIFPDLWARGPRPPGLWSGDYQGPDVAGVPVGGIHSKVYRSLRTKGPLQEAVSNLAKLQKAMPFLFERNEPMEPLSAPERHPGPQRLDELELARLAKAYVESGHDVGATAKRFDLSRSTTRGRISVARARGLLKRTGLSGKRGGVLTPLASELLKTARGRGRA